MHLIPEWCPQDAVLLTWPHENSDWQANLEKVEQQMLAFARAINQYEAQIILCYDLAHKNHLQSQFQQHHITNYPVTFTICPSNDSWARDHGPLGVEDHKQHVNLLNFNFNGWGEKYPHELDNRINQQLEANKIFPKLIHKDLILEGGSLEINSRQELLTTEQCLLNANRNALSKKQMEQKLENELGVKKFLWLKHGYLAGDDTDAHVDTMARFINDDTIAYVQCSDMQDEHYDALNKMQQELRAFRNTNNEPYQLVPLPWPEAKYNEDGERLPLTYANFLIINSAVLVPQYGVSTDRLALEILSLQFPKRDIIGVQCSEIIKQFGALHCLSMQLPRGILNDK